MNSVLKYLPIVLFVLFAGSPLQTLAEDTPLEKKGSDVTLLEFVICKDVVEREPIEILQSYTMDDERAWSFARISNTGKMSYVTFVWYYEDNVYLELDSRVGISKNWRTYSTVDLQPGIWRVELLNENGLKLDEVRFHVSE